MGIAKGTIPGPLWLADAWCRVRLPRVFNWYPLYIRSLRSSANRRSA